MSQSPAAPRVDVLGVGVSVTSMRSAVEEITRWIDAREQHYVCVTSVHGVMESQRDPVLMRIHNESGLTVPDGAPVLWAGRLAGAKAMRRMRGPDLLPALCELAAARGWRPFFYGGAPGTPERLAKRMRERFPALQVAGVHSPPFRRLTDAERADEIARINDSGAELVLVGLSTPKQEYWMAENVGRLIAPVLVGLGAAFDVHSGVIPQAPPWLRPTGLEWLYRLAHDPRRLWRRYLRNNPAFAAKVLLHPPRLR